MRIFFDTEFIEDGTTIELLSIGLVREDGKELYLENQEADWSRAGEWVIQNVLPHLDMARYGTTRREIRSQILSFAGPQPEFWGYYADYDWVVLCQLFGTMMDLPRNWPKYCMDLKQMAMHLGNPRLPEQLGIDHHALNDARYNRFIFGWLDERWTWNRP